MLQLYLAGLWEGDADWVSLMVSRQNQDCQNQAVLEKPRFFKKI